MLEVEIRSIVDNPIHLQDLLRDAGFSCEPSFEQLDIILDKPDASLFRSGQKIRLRIQKDLAELTYKGVFQGDSTACRREEITIPVELKEVKDWISFFTRLGYPECFRIPKTRTIFRHGAIQVTFDEWPIIGCLLEIEGIETKCKEIAKFLVPGKELRNYRLKELFLEKTHQTGKSLSQLRDEYEQE